MISIRNYLVAFYAVVVVATSVYAQTFNNVVVDANSGDQSETSIAIEPNHPNHLMATWNDFSIGSYSKPGWAFSTDGGNNWYAKGTITPSASDLYGFDPSCTIGTNGNEYYAYIASSGSGNYGPVDVSISTNDGQSWSTHQASQYPSDHDKPYIAIDNTSSSYKGNIYVAYESSYLDNNGVHPEKWTRS